MLLRRFKRLILRVIYSVYLWSSSSPVVPAGLSERIIEYPFAIHTLLSAQSVRKVLIVGCYGDLLTTLLPTLGFEAYGIDPKFVPVVYEGFNYTRADIRATEFPDQFFDAVVAISTIEHVGLAYNDLNGDSKALTEIKRITKDNGLVVVTTPITDKMKIDTLERFYDRSSLMKLLENLTIESMTIYRSNSDSCWVPTQAWPHAPDVGVALIKARKC